MNLRLRQVVLVAQHKAETVEAMKTVLGATPVHGSGDLSPYGLPAMGPMSEGGRKVLADLGVENLIFAMGADFIEVMFPTRPDGSTISFMARRGGDTGYMLVLQTDDVERYEVLAGQHGVRIAHKAEFPKYLDIHLHPRDCGGALLSMARELPENVPDGPWYPAGTAWKTSSGSSAVSAVVGAEMLSPDPQALAERWGRLLDLPVAQADGKWIIRLDDGVLRFGAAAEGQKEGFYGIDLRVSDRARIDDGARKAGIAVDGDTLTLCGMSVRLVD
ncbi:hypothetical protein KRR38_14735 [Novosphingobium sp. G106]|uniref:hypothetical protein n=1 Tax=Novosphingobium sp. G106 TaxID=2849500 RepID=UPI001C2DD7C2|nr:hypothetical protein [Novosphingobium sp. G106]MBV1688893.1 hypothetical protein [Novosphingobium sp. G106]